jgi:hypothetical protein
MLASSRWTCAFARQSFPADLVTAHGWVLVFLQLRAEIVEFGCDCGVCLGELILEGFVPAEGNQSRDDYNFSQ